MTQRWGFNPWAYLKTRPDIRLRFARLAGCTGRIDAAPGGKLVITIHSRLDQVERNAALCHELVHAERGLLPAGATREMIQREERAVRDETARRLCPPDLLADFVQNRVLDFGCCEARDVAELFEVPIAIAERAMGLLARGRHPTAGAA